MTIRKLAAVAFGATIVAVLAAGSTEAWSSPAQTTYVMFNRSVSLPGVELAAGTYIFELADPSSNTGMVQVMSRDRRTLYTRQFTRTVQRPANVSASGITFGEAPAGQAPPVKAWYPSGQDTGHAFIQRR